MALRGRRPVVAEHQLVPVNRLDRAIFVLRGQRVMLDAELALLYDVQTRELVQNVKRNIERFPDDFMFQLTTEEFGRLRSQSVISKPDGRGGRRRAPYAFTEQGVAMLSSVLRSRRAVLVNVEIMRAFVRVRRMLQENAHLARRLSALEKKSNTRFSVVFDAIRELMTPPAKLRRQIGFGSGDASREALNERRASRYSVDTFVRSDSNAARPRPRSSAMRR